MYVAESTYFVGRRYMLERETAVMLLFDSCGKIAGIQNGVRFVDSFFNSLCGCALGPSHAHGMIM